MTAAIMRQNLVVLAATYGAHRKIATATVSLQIYGRQDFFTKYAAGEVSPTVDKYFSMVERFRERWPEDKPWPKLAPVPNLGISVHGSQPDNSEAERIG